MNTRMLLAMCLMIAVASIATSLGHAKEIAILLKNGTERRVDLLSVRDSALVVCSVIDASDNALSTNPHLATLLPLPDIDRIRMEGKSYVATGLAVGLVGGGLVGGLIGSAVKTESEKQKDVVSTLILTPIEKDANTVGGVLIGTLVGALVGAAIGSGASTPERTFDPHARGERELLREYARYPRMEPAFLRDVTAE